jgi:hypothetical protein
LVLQLPARSHGLRRFEDACQTHTSCNRTCARIDVRTRTQLREIPIANLVKAFGINSVTIILAIGKLPESDEDLSALDLLT